MKKIKKKNASSRPRRRTLAINIPKVVDAMSKVQKLRDAAGSINTAINNQDIGAFQDATVIETAKKAYDVLMNPELQAAVGGLVGAAKDVGQMFGAGQQFLMGDPQGPTNVAASVGWSKVTANSAASLGRAKKLHFRINRFKGKILKEMAKKQVSTKIYSYKSVVSDRFRYHAGGNVKGIIAPYDVSPPAYSTTLSGLTIPTSSTLADGSQDFTYPFVWGSNDDQALVKSMLTEGLLADQVSSTDGVAGFPIQSKHISFSIYNSDRFLNCEVTVMLVRAKLSSNTPPWRAWIPYPTEPQSNSKMSNTYVKYVELLTPLPLGCTTAPYGEVSTVLGASPGLSSGFKKFWDIVQVKKCVLTSGGSLDVELTEEMSKPLMTSKILLDAGSAFYEGSYGFIITFKGIDSVVCVKNSTTSNNAQYDFVLQAPPVRLRVANIRKYAMCSANTNQQSIGNTIWTDVMNNLCAPRQVVIDTTKQTFAYQSEYSNNVGAADNKFAIPIMTNEVETSAGPMVPQGNS